MIKGVTKQAHAKDVNTSVEHARVLESKWQRREATRLNSSLIFTKYKYYWGLVLRRRPLPQSSALVSASALVSSAGFVALLNLASTSLVARSGARSIRLRPSAVSSVFRALIALPVRVS